MLLVAILGVASIHLVTAARRRLRRITAVAEAIGSTLRRDGRDEAVDELLEAVRRMLKADVAWLALVPPRLIDAAGRRADAGDATQLRPTNLTRGERALLDLVGRERGVLQLRPPVVGAAERRARRAQARPRDGRLGAAATVMPLRCCSSGGRADDGSTRTSAICSLSSPITPAPCSRTTASSARCSEVVVLKEQLRHRADHDALTGLPNRALFTARLDRALRDAIDAADASRRCSSTSTTSRTSTTRSATRPATSCSSAVAQRRRSSTIRPATSPRGSAGTSSRCSSSASGSDDGERVATRVVDALDAPFAVAGTRAAARTPASASPTAPRAGSRPTTCSATRDLAMYEAKSSGKRRFARYEPAMQDRHPAPARARRPRSSALRVRGEIDVHYQPIVDLGTGRARRRRGTGTLEPARARARGAVRVHRRRGRGRSDGRDRSLRAAGGLRAGARLAASLPGARRPRRRGQPRADRAARRRARRRRPGRPRRRRVSIRPL